MPRMSPHRDTLVRMVLDHKWVSGAELGVDKGILFNMLLTCCPELSLLGVDLGLRADRRAKCEGIAQRHHERAQFMVMSTHEASRMVPDESFDFVFIDADHSDKAVTQDIDDWLPKVRKGGWIGGHDYNHKFPGVIAAVDRAFGSRVKTFQPGSIWGVWR